MQSNEPVKKFNLLIYADQVKKTHFGAAIEGCKSAVVVLEKAFSSKQNDVLSSVAASEMKAIVPVPGKTAGPLCSCFLAVDLIDPELPFVISLMSCGAEVTALIPEIVNSESDFVTVAHKTDPDFPVLLYFNQARLFFDGVRALLKKYAFENKQYDFQLLMKDLRSSKALHSILVEDYTRRSA